MNGTNRSIEEEVDMMDGSQTFLSRKGTITQFDLQWQGQLLVAIHMDIAEDSMMDSEHRILGWEKITLSKDKGGLRIQDFGIQKTMGEGHISMGRMDECEIYPR